ncbi:hypothetical protein EYF80_003576 [Liparis tanakae]|uniref:Uncharacterized protein n=1 Tax=Liparis tanakae TaxID=230148 RepID=A0A4Z2J7J6_9TELE|nr:hypothetical protein EYF80_003576 [Liparis tanakae]
MRKRGINTAGVKSLLTGAPAPHAHPEMLQIEGKLEPQNWRRSKFAYGRRRSEESADEDVPR